MARYRISASSNLLLCKAKISTGKNSLFLKMVVDTGSSVTLIRPQSLTALGINMMNPVRYGRMTHAGGNIEIPIVTIPTLECFGVSVGPLEIACHLLPSESGLHGLLGLDFLRAAKIILNFHANTLEIPGRV